jgi:virginiamycin B lyase
LRGSRAKGFRFRKIACTIVVNLLFTLVFFSTTPAVASSTQATYITEDAVPTANSAPLAITVDPNGIVWFTESNASKLGRFDPSNRTFKEYPVPAVGDMWGITVDPNGYIWMTEYAGRGSVNPGGNIVGGGHGRLLRFNPRTSNFTSVDIPTNSSFPFRLVADAAGRIWFTELLGNKLGLYDPNSNRLEEYSVPSYFAGPADLTFDAHGNLWFTEAYNESVGEFKPLNTNFTEYHFATNDPSLIISSPVGIAVGRDGNVWFADHGGNWIGEFNPVSKALRRYPTSPPSGAYYGIAIPNGLLMAQDGSIWFCEHWGNRIGHFDPQSQSMTEYTIPTGPISSALWLAEAPNHDIWFTEWSTSKIGVLHAGISPTFSVGVGQNELSLAAGREATLTISTYSGSGSAGNGTLTYSWSSYNPNEVTVIFSPDAYPSLEGPANTQDQAQVKVSSKVSPGNYTLAIGIETGTVRASRMVRVYVTPGGQTGFAFSGTLSYLILALVLAIGTAAWLLRKMSSASRVPARDTTRVWRVDFKHAIAIIAAKWHYWQPLPR